MTWLQRAFPGMSRAAWGAVTTSLLCLIFLGCGDVFRPVAIPVAQPGGDPAQQHRAIVVNSNPAGNGSITDIDVAGDTVMSVHQLGKVPVHAAALANSVVTYVANSGDDSVSAFNTFGEAGTTPTVVALPAGSRPVFVLPSVGGDLFIASAGANAVHRMSIALNVVTATIPVGASPVALAQVPTGLKIYSLNQGDGTVSIVDPLDNTVTGSIRVGTAPTWSAMNPDGTRLYVANRGSNNISIIDTSSDTVLATVPVGTAPNFVLFDASLHRVYVTNSGSNTLSIIRADIEPNSVIATVAVGSTPLAVAALADGTRAYVANSASNTVSVINTTNNTVAKTVSVGTAPVFLASSPDSLKVMVTNRDSNNISVITTATDTVTATITTASPKPVYVLITQ